MEVKTVPLEDMSMMVTEIMSDVYPHGSLRKSRRQIAVSVWSNRFIGIFLPIGRNYRRETCCKLSYYFLDLVTRSIKGSRKIFGASGKTSVAAAFMDDDFGDLDGDFKDDFDDEFATEDETKMMVLAMILSMMEGR